MVFWRSQFHSPDGSTRHIGYAMKGDKGNYRSLFSVETSLTQGLYCCACEVTLVITDTLIAVFTYLLTYKDENRITRPYS